MNEPTNPPIISALTPFSRTPISRRHVDGVLLLDKPSGLTSNGALMRVKRLYNAEKAGHTGTLDPLASGLLPICFGEATKFAQALLDAPKRYVATVRFGVTTTTQDAEGDDVAVRAVAFDYALLAVALQRFIGRQMQVPPAYSALKHKGRPHYDYARAGIDVPRVPREIEIRSLRLTQWHEPDAVVEVECSKGTYIRAIAADIGEALGCGAHLAALRRTQTGRFAVEDAVALATLETMDSSRHDALLLSSDAPVASMPRLDVREDAATSLRQGRAIASTDNNPGRYRCYSSGEFLGLIDIAGGAIRPARLIHTR